MSLPVNKVTFESKYKQPIRHNNISSFLCPATTDYPFIHLDIAGVAMFERKRDYILKGASGYGVRLIVEFVKSLIEKQNL